MDQPKIKNVNDKIGNLSLKNIKLCIMLKYFYVLCTFLNRSKIAKQYNCKHYTKLELISDFYHTRF